MTMSSLEKSKSIYNDIRASEAKFFSDLDKQDRIISIVMFTMLGVIVIGSIIAIIVAGLQNTWYDYIDTNGEYGQAEQCYSSKGNLLCRNNSRVFHVTEYTRHIER